LQLFLQVTGFGLVDASILALAAVGFTLQWGVGKFINLAYVYLMMLSAFLDYTLTQTLHLEFWLSAALSIGAVGLVSMGMNHYLVLPLARRGVRFFDLLIAGFGVGIVVEFGLQAIYGENFFQIKVAGTRPLKILGMHLTPSQLVIIGIAVLVMVMLHVLLTKTDIGRAIRAISVNPTLAQSCGVRVDFVLNLLWLMSGVLCGLSGLVLAFDTSLFNSGTSAVELPFILAIAMVGGIGSAYGAMGAALLIGLVSNWVDIVNPQYGIVVAVFAGGLVLLLRPEGLFRSPMASLAGSV